VLSQCKVNNRFGDAEVHIPAEFVILAKLLQNE
jgi:hypothetical protein